MRCDRRQQTRTLAILLACIVLCTIEAGAVQEPYDIDLKELRRTPTRRTIDQRSRHESTASVTATHNSKGENSSYTVLPGDHLFLILMQRYGLSNRAAEQLIPEIIRLNNIRKPESLSVGQRLIIPLPPTTDKATKADRSPLPESITAPPHTVDTPHVREVAVAPSRPCRLARKVAEQLGARVSALSPFIDVESISLSYKTLEVATFCGLGTAEAYTLERLLASHKIKLLYFKADETPRNVIEEIAKTLGISFDVLNTDKEVELPLTYLFHAVIDGKDLRLKLGPVLPASN